VYWRGLSVDRANEYRRKAEECVGFAQRATDPADKAMWLRMAENWQKLVENADRRIIVQVAADKLAEQDPPITN
jgi:hypothetical protein